VTRRPKVPTDIAIAQAAELGRWADIAAELGLDDEEIELYGSTRRRCGLPRLARRKPKGRLVLVTGSPDTAGEGKSTVTSG